MIFDLYFEGTRGAVWSLQLETRLFRGDEEVRSFLEKKKKRTENMRLSLRKWDGWG